MKRNRAALIFGIAVLGVFAVCALIPGIIAPYGEKEMSEPWLSPCREHLLGTNDLGYDILTELIYAAGSTLLIGISAALISLVLGTLLGLVSGYVSGIGGDLCDGIIQIFLMIPMLPMAIVIGSFLGTKTVNIILIIAVLGWCATARTVRTRTMQLKQTPLSESLIILGFPKRVILFRHILPNLREVILSRYIMTVAKSIMLEATLSFLGMGDPMDVTWGRMINTAYKRGAFTTGSYNWLITPGICIALTVTAFYAINSYFEAKAGEVGTAGSYMD